MKTLIEEIHKLDIDIAIRTGDINDTLFQYNLQEDLKLSIVDFSKIHKELLKVELKLKELIKEN